MTAFLIVCIILFIVVVAQAIAKKVNTHIARQQAQTNIALESVIRSEVTDEVLGKLDKLNPNVYDLYDVVLQLYDTFDAPVYNFATLFSGNLYAQQYVVEEDKIKYRCEAWSYLRTQVRNKYPTTGIDLIEFTDEHKYSVAYNETDYQPFIDKLGNSFDYKKFLSMFYDYYGIKDKQNSYSSPNCHCASSMLLSIELAIQKFDRKYPINFKYLDQNLIEYVSLYEFNPIKFRDEFKPSLLYNLSKKYRNANWMFTAQFFWLLGRRIDNLIEVLVMRRLKEIGFKRSPDGKHDSVWQEKYKEDKFTKEYKERYPQDFNN